MTYLFKSTILVLLCTLLGFVLISCSTNENSIEDFVEISNELSKTQTQLKELQTKLVDAEFKVAQYEVKLAQYTKTVDADYPNLLRRVEQARLIIKLINVSSAYRMDMASEMELMSTIGNAQKIDSRIVKDGLIKMMQSGQIMNDESADTMILAWLDEVDRLLE
ncbi:MAG: hypothetical protein DK302_000926 [Chloroflexi bacterium]|jgi:hypothetical protein|nr:MAG: hypothetical protein DK302_000926 [Chloroflexota bacterium]